MFFFLKILFLFSSDAFFFFSKCILLDLFVRVFLEPNIHGYIDYMFMYILNTGSEHICTY